ncbi:hypothetical protein CBM2587_A150009 [Cupriavidus taiwanensis]|uniref:Uncharacterized protein n=1 Tax=Cupriavidus taiwanensis TaxID=164546 RepID=A0A375BHV9_9BURK|nr:hypothetical protein CBM2587_A150009 [Cupriavidus taiwanensis]
MAASATEHRRTRASPAPCGPAGSPMYTPRRPRHSHQLPGPSRLPLVCPPWSAIRRESLAWRRWTAREPLPLDRLSRRYLAGVRFDYSCSFSLGSSGQQAVRKHRSMTTLHCRLTDGLRVLPTGVCKTLLVGEQQSDRKASAAPSGPILGGFRPITQTNPNIDAEAEQTTIGSLRSLPPNRN